MLVLDKMGLVPGRHLTYGCRRLNRKRLYMAEYKNCEKSKKWRKVIRGQMKAKDDKTSMVEGKLYKAGAF